MENQLPPQKTDAEISPDHTIKLSDSEISHAGKSARRINAQRRVKFLDNDIEGLKSTLTAGASALNSIFSFAKDTLLPDFKNKDEQLDTEHEATEHIIEIKHLKSVETATQLDVVKLPLLENCYEIIREFAGGGQGIIYKAKDLALNRIVALKSLRKELLDKKMVYDSFVAEALITAQLDHPSIVSIYNILRDNENGIHLAMKLVRGKDLRTYLNEVALQFSKNEISKQAYEFRLPRRLEMFLKICDALAYAHSRSIIHCDLKPENIMLGEYGEVYVMDWGIARVIRDADGKLLPQDDTKPLDGTPRFIPPEAYTKKHRDERADVYALGMILYEILTLRHAYDGEDVQSVIKQIKANDRQPVVHKFGYPIASDLVAIVEKAIAYDVEERYQSVPELSRDIQRYLAGEAVEAAPEGIIGSTFRWLTRHSRSVVLLGIAGWLIAALSASHVAQKELSALSEHNKQQARALKRATAKQHEQEMLRQIIDMDSAAVQSAMAISNHMAILASELTTIAATVSRVTDLPYYVDDTRNLPVYPYKDFQKDGQPGRQGSYADFYKCKLNLDCLSFIYPGLADNAPFPGKLGTTLHKLKPICVALERLVLESDDNELTQINLAALHQRLAHEGMMMRRAYISFADTGLHISYPGHGNYASDYDPRQRQWYKDCVAAYDKHKSTEATWSKPYVDADSGQILIACTVPMLNYKTGKFLGTASFDLNFTKFKNMFLKNGNTDFTIVDAKYLLDQQGKVVAQFATGDRAHSVDISPFALHELQDALKNDNYGHCIVIEENCSLQYHFAYMPKQKLYVVERSTIALSKKPKASNSTKK